MTKASHQRSWTRFLSVVLAAALAFGGYFIYHELSNETSDNAPRVVTGNNSNNTENTGGALAIDKLKTFEVKGRAQKTDYSRAQFGEGWAKWKSCDTRQRILGRDLTKTKYGTDGCTVLSGALHDPYTGKVIDFVRGTSTSSAVQIDHVVALADAWQKGAQYWDASKREQLANDDLELLAVDGPTNQQKGAGDAATWLPPNKSYRCAYIARQIAVKVKYALWVTSAEKAAMENVLTHCPDERLPAT